MSEIGKNIVAGIIILLSIGLSAFVIGGAFTNVTIHTLPLPPQAELNHALRDAKVFWKREACGGKIKVQTRNFIGNPDLAGEGENCTITYAPQVEQYGWQTFCVLTLHEYGHLLGKHHVTDTHNIMYPDAAIVDVPPICIHKPHDVKGPVKL